MTITADLMRRRVVLWSEYVSRGYNGVDQAREIDSIERELRTRHHKVRSTFTRKELRELQEAEYGT